MLSWSAPDFAFDKHKNVYVADRENHRIVKWSKAKSTDTITSVPELIAGKMNRSSNQHYQNYSKGSLPGELRFPYGIDIDSFGNLYFADIEVVSYGSDNNRQTYEKYRIHKIQLAPQIVIPAGSLSSALQVNALEEYPSDNEDDETIILTPNAINANLSSSDPTTITIKTTMPTAATTT